MANETAAIRTSRVAVGTQAAFGLSWLVATLWTAHASIVGNAEDPSVALSAAAAALPGVIAATLLAGACAGLVATTQPLPGLPTSPQAPRWRGLIGAGAGLLVGLLCLGAILFGYGANASVVRLAATVAVAGALGGAAAALPPRVLGAGLVGTSVAFVVGLVFSPLQSPLSGLLGAGDTVASRASASTNLAYLQSAVTGLLAGYLAYRVLRPSRRPWPWFLLAGVLAGLLLLVAEALTHLGGSSLQSIVKGFSPLDQAVVEFTDFARFRHAMVVLFVGGITAMIAVGRTLSRPADDPATAGSAPADKPTP